MKNYKNLNAWKVAKDIAVKVHELSSQFNPVQQFSFAAQISRSALSIPSNIAEGNSRQSQKEYARYIEIALGSSFELETQLMVIDELKIAESGVVSEIQGMVTEEQKMLFGLLKKLRANP